LVVDPALVVLESLQSKKELGLSFQEAILESMKDIGDGLLSSTLTNIIVFLPFAIVSGVLGKIFSYIPLTIIPALVGSYLVAIIFLAWLGGFILKRNPKASNSEQENLWAVSKWVIKINEFILNVNGSVSS
jgi:HAE1 family hydrophobic/amphiphilic exporter-1